MTASDDSPQETLRRAPVFYRTVAVDGLPIFYREAGHFALDTAADRIAELVAGFMDI